METSVHEDRPPKYWHIYWQAAPGRDLLLNPWLVERIKARLVGAHRSGGRGLIYYLLLQQEIHLISRLPVDDSPRTLASGLANVIARRVREADGCFGPVFVGRYQAHRVERVEVLGHEIRMLGWRPVGTGLRAAPTHFPHAALRAILGLGLADGVEAGAVLAHFGSSVPLARHAIRKLLANTPTTLEVLQWELAHGLARARATRGPPGSMARQVRGAAAVLVAASEPQGIDGALELLEGWVRAKLGPGAGPDLSLRRGVESARGRALVAGLAVNLGLCSAATVARHFGRSRATLSEQMTRSSTRAADRAILAIPAERIVSEAIELATHAEHRGGPAAH